MLIMAIGMPCRANDDHEDDAWQIIINSKTTAGQFYVFRKLFFKIEGSQDPLLGHLGSPGATWNPWDAERWAAKLLKTVTLVISA